MRGRTGSGRLGGLRRALFAAAGVGTVAVAAWAAGGDFDASFGPGGVATTAVEGYGQARAFAVQSDGKSILAGFDEDPPTQWRIRRYDTDGALDATFGTAGSAVLFSSAERPIVSCLCLDGDDLLVGGTTTVTTTKKGKTTSTAVGTIVRFTADGAVDTSFGASGVVRIPDTLGVGALAALPDGMILAACLTSIRSKGSSNTAWALARLTASGSLDGSFGSDGIAIWNPTSGDDGMGNGGLLALLPDGDFVVGGYANGLSTGDAWVLARFSSSGTLEATLTRAGSRVAALSVGTSGRVLAAGYLTTSTSAPSVVARYVSSASGLELDASFGNGGERLFNLPGITRFSCLGGIALDGSGRIHVAGHDILAPKVGWLVRLTTIGDLDATFGDAGVAGPVDLLGGFNFPRGVAVDGAGRVLMGGYSMPATGASGLWWVARFLAD